MSRITEDGFLFSVWPGGTRLLVVQSYRLAECVAYCREKQIQWLEINGFSYDFDDLEFLRDCGHVIGLFVDALPDMSGLYQLDKLAYLKIRSQSYIKLSNLPALGHLEVDWSPGVARSLPDCKSLLRLSLSGYKAKSADLSDLKSLTTLRSLKIVRSAITSLKGIDSLGSLSELCLAYCPKLANVSALTNLPLEQLELDHCKRFPLGDLEMLVHLRKMILADCGSVPSLQFLRSMPEMEFLSFVGTTVADGDMTPLFGLKYAGFLNKRTYSHTFAQVEHIIKERTHGQDLSWEPPPGDVLPMLVKSDPSKATAP